MSLKDGTWLFTCLLSYRVLTLTHSLAHLPISLLLAQSVLSGACVYVIHVQLLIYLNHYASKRFKQQNVARVMGQWGVLGLRWMWG